MKILNPGRILADQQLWGTDPVHPSISGYKKVVNFLVMALDFQNKAVAIEAKTQKRPAEEIMAGPSKRPY
jgi:hypothetical protein